MGITILANDKEYPVKMVKDRTNKDGIQREMRAGTRKEMKEGRKNKVH